VHSYIFSARTTDSVAVLTIAIRGATAGYVGLSSTFTMGNFVRPLSVRFGLLTEDEMSRIDELNPDDEEDPEQGVVAKREVLGE
jgi:hypothetical protein